MEILRDNISIWENALSAEWCEKLIADVDKKINAASLERPEQKNRTVGGVTFCDNKKRLDISLILEDHQSLNLARHQLLKSLENCLAEMSALLKERGHCGSPEIYDCEPVVCKLQKTPPGGGFSVWHYEQGVSENMARRWGVWMLYLNTVERGGKTDFPNQEMSLQPEAGKMVIWPAAYTHPHRSAPDLEEEKYIVTGWLVYPETKESETELSRL